MKTIIEMAEESGMARIIDEHSHEYGSGVLENTLCPELEAFAALVAAAENEACAKVCDAKFAEYPEIDPDYAFALAASDLAKTIRARGQA
jgi:hypothetical protein